MIRGQSTNSGRAEAKVAAGSHKAIQQPQHSSHQGHLGTTGGPLSLQHHSEGLRQIRGQQPANTMAHSSMTTISMAHHGSQAETISDFKAQHLRGSRSPYGRGEGALAQAHQAAGKASGQYEGPGGQGSDGRTPGASRGHYQGHGGSSGQQRHQNFSLKDSQDLLRFPEQQQRLHHTTVAHTLSTHGPSSSKSSKTQRLVQKSVDGKESRKVIGADGASAGREQLLWAQAQNVYASNNFTQALRTTTASSKEDHKNLSSSKTQRQGDDTVQRQQRFRVSTESHVSGISGILANTQLTAMSVASASHQNSGIKRQPHAQALGDGGDRLSDEVLVVGGGQTVKQPRQANQQDSGEVEDCQKLEGFEGKRESQSSLTSGSIQQRSTDPASKNLLNSESNKMNQSTFSGNVHLLGAPQSKVYNSIEEAQPILRLCLLNVGSASVSSLTAPSGFAALLPDSDIDQNLICPACKFLVVNPVECQSCQYIICFKCAQSLNMHCQNSDPSCNNGRFTSQPGKIHKLYRAMLSQLEFRCPNHGGGCQSVLKYDQLAPHLLTQCELRDRLCPNDCGDGKKRSLTALKEHLERSCPREKVECAECEQKVARGEMERHLSEDCLEVRVRCRHCEQHDTRGAFRRGQHDCISVLKDTISQMRESAARERRRSQGQRSQSAGRRGGARRASGLGDYQHTQVGAPASQQDLDLVMRQVQHLKQDLQNMDHLVTDDIFRMFDNMSLCVTQKDEEVKDLTKKVKKLEEANEELGAKFCAQARDYEGLVAALDFKLEEKFQALKKTQEAEIRNMKRMLLKQSQSDMPLQMQPKKERKVAEPGPPHHSALSHVSIRGPTQAGRVPPINFIDSEQAQALRANNGANPSQAEPQEAQDIDQDDISHIVAQGAQIREQQKHFVPEVIEEEDFVPFLSSTDNELTDLNTEFNTDRPGGAESSAPQSTYRSRTRLSSKISNRNNLAIGGQRSDKNAASAAADAASLHASSQQHLLKQASRASTGALQPPYHAQPDHRSHARQAPPTSSGQPSGHESNTQKAGSGGQAQSKQPSQQTTEAGVLEGPRRSASTSHAADMSFDNESVQNDRENKSEENSRGQASADESNQSFANNDEEDIDASAGCENITVQAQGKREAVGGGKRGGEERTAGGAQRQLEERRHKDGAGVAVPSSARLVNQSDPFASILDESSDLEQIQNNQLPGSIHGGANTSAASGFNSHLQSLHSQRSQGASAVSASDGQFSALSRGQLFGQGKEAGAANGHSPGQSRDLNSDYSVGLANGLGLTTDRERTDRDSDVHPLGTIDSQPPARSNGDPLTSLEHLDAPQISLDRKAAEPAKPAKAPVDDPNRPCAQGDTGLAASGTSLDGNIIASASEDERQLSLRKLLVAQTNFVEEPGAEQVDPQVFQDLEMLIKSDNLSAEERRALEAEIWKFNQSQREKGRSRQEGEDEEERQRGVGERQERRPGDSEVLPSDYEEQQTDLEGNETENEVIRDHLDQLQAIGGQGGGIASALKGLESDLETIFETDLESNYVTTSRTNLSTRKLLNQAHNMAHMQQLNAQLSNPRSQERLSRILLSQCSPIAHAGSASHYSSSNFKRGGSGNQKDQAYLQPPQGGSAKMTNLSSTNSKRKHELEDTMSPGANATDTSQSMLVSNRSNPVQQVKASQNLVHPGRHQSPNLSARQHAKPPVAAQAHCFLTSEQLGQLTQQVQQSQQDREEHRIRVYTSGTNSHSSRPLALPVKPDKQQVAVPRDHQIVVNRFQEIKEESIEDEADPNFDNRLRTSTAADKLKEIRQGLRDKFQHDVREPMMTNAGAHFQANQQDVMIGHLAEDERGRDSEVVGERNQDSFCNEEEAVEVGAGIADHHQLPQFVRGRDSSFDNGDDDLGTSCERQEDVFQFK